MRALVLLVALAACVTPEPAAPQPRARPLALIEQSVDLDGHVIGPAQSPTIVVLMASWCGHCRMQLQQLGELRAAHPSLRIVGVNYRGHEEYDNRGNAEQLRAYVSQYVPWLRVVSAGDALFGALGSPPFIPAVWVYDGDGALVEFYDRRVRLPPSRTELEALLARLGA